MTQIYNPKVPANVAYIKTGTYTGNGAANRAIAHGRSSAPACFFVTSPDEGAPVGEAYINSGDGNLIQVSVGTARAVTAPDITNIYVGAGGGGYANTNLKTYRWFALWG